MPSVIQPAVSSTRHRINVFSMGGLKRSGSSRAWPRISRKVSPGVGAKFHGHEERLPSTSPDRWPPSMPPARSPKVESILPANTCHPGPAGCRARSRPACEPLVKFPAAPDAFKIPTFAAFERLLICVGDYALLIRNYSLLGLSGVGIPDRRIPDSLVVTPYLRRYAQRLIPYRQSLRQFQRELLCRAHPGFRVCLWVVDSHRNFQRHRIRVAIDFV